MTPFFINVWKSVRGTVKRNILSEVGDDIASGALSNPSFRNADEYMNAFMRGALTPQENFKITRALINNVGLDTQKKLAQGFVENKSIVTEFSGKSRTQFREKLKEIGFTDDSVRAIEEAWSNNGLKFNKLGGFTSDYVKKLNRLRMTDTGSFFREFGKGLSNSLPNDPFRIAYRNLLSVKWPWKGIWSNPEARKRLLTWFFSGQKRLPSEIRRDFINAKGLSGSNFKGVMAVLGGVLGTWVRTYIAFSLFLTFVQGLKNTVRDNSIRGQSMEGEHYTTVAWYRFLESIRFADYSYLLPFVVVNDLFQQYLKPLIAGNFEEVESQVKSEIIELENQMTSELVKKDLFRHLTPSQQNEIGEDVNGNLFYTSPLYPVKKINGVWAVYLPNEGWYDVKDID